MFTMQFATDNDAFAEDPVDETVRILRLVEARLKVGATSGSIQDSNGNTIGEWTLSEES